MICETQQKKMLNEALVSAVKTHDVENIRKALENGADPNYFVATKKGKVRIYDYLNNQKGKYAKDALDTVYRFGGRSEKSYAQRKKLTMPRVTMASAKRKKDERIRRRQKEKEAQRSKV